jgi:hypothetical protein
MFTFSAADNIDQFPPRTELVFAGRAYSNLFTQFTIRALIASSQLLPDVHNVFEDFSFALPATVLVTVVTEDHDDPIFSIAPVCIGVRIKFIFFTERLKVVGAVTGSEVFATVRGFMGRVEAACRIAGVSPDVGTVRSLFGRRRLGKKSMP